MYINNFATVYTLFRTTFAGLITREGGGISGCFLTAIRRVAQARDFRNPFERETDAVRAICGRKDRSFLSASARAVHSRSPRILAGCAPSPESRRVTFSRPVCVKERAAKSILSPWTRLDSLDISIAAAD